MVDTAKPRPLSRRPYVIYVLFVHTPITIAAFLSDDVTKHGVPVWIAITLGVTLAILLVPLIAVTVQLAKIANAESAAMAKVPRPVRCDRCGIRDPAVCPDPHLGTCPLRSIDTGQTYRDFLEKPGAAGRGSDPRPAEE